jgi:hypothetical protein
LSFVIVVYQYHHCLTKLFSWSMNHFSIIYLLVFVIFLTLHKNCNSFATFMSSTNNNFSLETFKYSMSFYSTYKIRSYEECFTTSIISSSIYIILIYYFISLWTTTSSFFNFFIIRYFNTIFMPLFGLIHHHHHINPLD